MKKIILTGAAITLAAAAVMLPLAGCGAGGDAKALDASYSYAESKVKNFSSKLSYNTAAFYDKIFSTANVAAMIVNEKTTDEDFEKVARFLFLDSITVTDEKGTIVASYPDSGEKGKRLKDIEDKRIFNRVVKGISYKLMSDPAPVEGTDEYSLLAGVVRGETPGAVVVGLKTNAYSDVTGEKLADQCGANSVVLSDGVIISSTLDKAQTGKKLEDLGVKSEDIKSGSFDMTLDGTKYSCKAGTIDNYTLICAQPE